MTSTTTDTSPETTDHSTDDDDLDHLICWCNENRALCGKDVTDLEFSDCDADFTDMCVVCIELGRDPCPKCGA